ncbi:MAG: hypothetical protein RMY16_12825 [Nostoc sp. DedQUE12b]|uniref:hypothetical protein n=1 Tax=Nostoc sp. DedQUE12b TaxID=3075398 RepID=UPI002AD2BBD6|nr:hypothetical protein [Nostoc sp. DedQUE12b]MDZ8086423.1 hypothetical protein [Nostoc sp. DedQUE12b]
MVNLKIFPFLLSLGLALIPQITVAQTVEELEQKATSAEEVKNYEEAANIWRSLIERDDKSINLGTPRNKLSNFTESK